jgi:Zn-dependent protease
MFGRSFRIATIRGIPVNVDSSWIWIAVIAVYSLWTRFERSYPGLGDGQAIAYALVAAALFFGSVFLHEVAHAVTARLAGIRVEGITLVFFGGFTAARSEERGPGPAFAIALLGPLTSLTLGGLFWAASSIDEGDGPLSTMFGYVGYINLFMAIFNVLPGLPLDGGRVLQAVVWGVTRSRATGTRIAAKAGLGVGILLFVAAAYEISRQNVFSAIWLGLIGLFIFQGARASEQQAGVADRLAAATVADAMDPPPPAVPADMTLSETLDRFLRGREGEFFPVIEGGGRVIGVISFDSARAIGSVDPLRPARDAVVPLEHVAVLRPDERLDKAASRLGSRNSALVLRDGTLVGSLTGGGVYRWVRSHARSTS